MTQLLIFEFLHASMTAFIGASPGLRSEGRAMLLALVEDARYVSGTDISVLLCNEAAASLRHELPTFVRTITAPAHGADGIFSWLHEAAGSADVIFPVAPESDNVLLRVAEALRPARRVLLPPIPVLELCNDKLLTCKVLGAAGIPIVPTISLSRTSIFVDTVVKHRLGAGCEGIFRGRAPPGGRTEDYVCQPFVDGQSLSVGILSNGEAFAVLPVAEQRIEWKDGAPQYHGGRIPARVSDSTASQAREIAVHVMKQFGSFAGYLGIDLMESSDGIVLLSEINPRLCTSYIGYRKLLGLNPLAVILGEAAIDGVCSHIHPNSGRCVEFSANGTIM